MCTSHRHHTYRIIAFQSNDVGGPNKNTVLLLLLSDSSSFTLARCQVDPQINHHQKCSVDVFFAKYVSFEVTKSNCYKLISGSRSVFSKTQQ